MKLSCWGSVSVVDGCSEISGDVSCCVASVVRLYLAAHPASVLCWHGQRCFLSPGCPHRAPASTGAGEGLQSCVPSSFPAQLPEQHWSTRFCGTGRVLDEGPGQWCAREATCGQLWLLSCKVGRGSMEGQSAQGCTPGPMSQPSPLHTWTWRLFCEKTLEFLEKMHLLSPPLNTDPLNESSVVSALNILVT